MRQQTNSDFAALQSQAVAIADPAARISYLVKNGRSFARTHAGDLLGLLQEAYGSVMEKQGNQRAENAALIGMAHCYSVLGEYKEAESLYTRSLSFFIGLKDYSGIGSTLQNLGIIYRSLGDYGSALDCYSRSAEARKKLKDQRPYAASLNSLGVFYSSIGDYERGLESFLEALRTYELTTDKYGQASALTNIGQVYVHLDDLTNALQHYERALAIRVEFDDIATQARLHDSISEVYLLQGKHDKALSMAEQALSTFRQIGDRLSEARCLGHISEVYEKKGELEQVLTYIVAGIELVRQVGEVEGLARLLYNAGRVQHLMEEYSQSQVYLAEALQGAEKGKLKELEQRIRFELGQVCAATGEYKQAFEYIHRASEIREELRSKEKERVLTKLQIQFNVERTNNEKELYRLRNEQLEVMMEQKSSELSAMAMHLVEKAELIASFKKQMKQIAETARDNAQELATRLLEEVEERTGPAHDWELFERRLNETHNAFIRTLTARYSDLTPSEIRVCSLLRLDLSTKDIAGLLSLSERNIEDHRYHIRKKLGLEKEEDLGRYLQEFDEDAASHGLASEDPVFTAVLSERYPDLSATELKVCALIRNNLSTKEIAEILSSSERTVQNHRYRIRKKLELSRDTNLTAFLAGV